MKRTKTMIQIETMPYITLFDLNKQWLDLKAQRLVLIEQVREIRTKGYNLTMQINKVEEQISGEIAKIEKR